MSISVAGQTIIFLSCIACGITIGIVFDLFRIIRRIIPTNDFITLIEDIIYWLIASVIVFAFILNFNSGELRWYEFLGVLLGVGMYLLTISSLIIELSIFVLQFIFKVFSLIVKIISVPIMFIYDLLKKPVFIVLNIGKRGSRRAKQNILHNFLVFKKIVTKI